MKTGTKYRFKYMETYENPKKCAVCGADMRLVPAGISKKTQREYKAFYVCPKNCLQPGKTYKNADVVFDKFGEMNDKLDRLINGMTMIHSQLEGLIEKK